MTVHCWGEDPRGLWTVIVTDNDNNNRKHYLEKLTKGDEEDVTRVFLDDTGEHHQTEPFQQSNKKGHAQGHVLKTMEDTAGEIFNGDGFAKFVHGKKAHRIHHKPRATVAKNNGYMRKHNVKAKETKAAHLKKQYWKTEKNSRTKGQKVKQLSKGVARKHIHPNANAVKVNHDGKSSKKHTSSKKLNSKTAFRRKHEKLKTPLKKGDSNGKTFSKPLETSGLRFNTTLTMVPKIVKTLNNSNASILKNANVSDNPTTLALITKLISEIQKNPLVTKIALDALKNPAIGKLFGIDSSTNVVETIQEKLSMPKRVDETKELSNGPSNMRGLSLNTDNRTVGRKGNLDTRVVAPKSEINETHVTEPQQNFKSERPATSIKHRGIQFFKILKDTQHGYRNETNGNRSEESGSYLDSGSGENPEESGSGNAEGFLFGDSQSLSCVWPKNCNDTKREDTSMPGSIESLMQTPKELEGEDDSLEANDTPDIKESRYGDGDGDEFFEGVKKVVGRDEDSDEIMPEFGLDLDSNNEYDRNLCSNFSTDSSSDSAIFRNVHCSENRTQPDEREKDDKTLAHYLAIDKLKSASGDNDPDSRDEQDGSSSETLNEDPNPSSDQVYSDTKYRGKDLEVLQEALEDQLSRLSKDPHSQKSNAEILARVRDDIAHGDIDDLELLEAQITDGKTELSRVVRSLSPEDENIDDLDGYVEAISEPFGEFNVEEEELERRRISHQVDQQKTSQTYYVDADKYGKDNSGILESWTLILYGTT